MKIVAVFDADRGKTLCITCREDVYSRGGMVATERGFECRQCVDERENKPKTGEKK